MKIATALLPHIIALSCVGVVNGLPSPQFDFSAFKAEFIITRDVCVIGGGSSGTYAAIALKDSGKSVVVIEQKDKLGGHTETYIDPATNAAIDIGVIAFHDLPVVRDYFARLNVSIATENLGGDDGGVTEYADFRTGKVLPGYTPPDFTTALQQYAGLVAQYPYLEQGFDLPDPVPADLLLPFGDYVAKYNIQNVVNFVYSFAQGLGDLLKQPTLYVFKNFGLGLIEDLSTGLLNTALNDNHLLYDAALKVLGSNALLSTQIIAMDRDFGDYARIIVLTPSGLRLIQAKQVVFSIPPKLSNLNVFDLSETEKSLFAQFGNSGYYTGLLRNVDIPPYLSLSNQGSNTLYNLPVLPGVYGFNPTGVPGLTAVKYGSQAGLSDDFVKSDIIATIKRFYPTSNPEFAIFSSHTPFELTVPVDAISTGFYRKLYALQGQRRTWYTGAAFHSQDSSLLWVFTKALIPNILAAL